jgi:hypothetical protein
MKKRRVGTTSMAIVLIAFGVIIFIAQINHISAVNLAIKFWPMILFLLGGEILWYSYRYKEEDINIRYDIFSIFIILVIVFMNLGIYGLIETGLMTKVNRMVLSENYTFSIPYNEIQVDDTIEKIVINQPNYYNLTIRTEENNKLLYSGHVDIAADSEEKAKELLNKEHMIAKKSGNTLYVSFMERPSYNRENYIRPYDTTLIIPKNKKVEITGGNDLQLVLDDIKNDWVIDSINRVKIRLDENIDAKINAFVQYQEILKGNVKWSSIEEGTEEKPKVKGELIYKNGSNNINILNCDEVFVDELK